MALGVSVSEYRKLENQPLKFVLAEFRFSPVMEIAEYIPKIQEKLRKQYPIPEKRSEQAFQVQSNGIVVNTIERWAFVSADKRSAIDISQERLVFVTSGYSRFEAFSEFCNAAIDILIKEVSPSLIMRIGLRYSDLVTVNEGEEFTDLVNDHFTVPSVVSGLGGPLHHSTDTYLNTRVGILAIRTLYGNIPHNCLPDIQGLPIAMSDDPVPSERLILDFDHFWEAKEESVNFDLNFVIDKLTALHDTSREAFWKLTSDYARDKKWA